MNKVLVVVDMQNDFITGALGSDEAMAIVPNVVRKIAEWNGSQIIMTLDTHGKDYADTIEGSRLPAHCIDGTHGCALHADITKALLDKPSADCKINTVRKYTFGSYLISTLIKEEPEIIEIVGLCTDICVISNALLLKAAFPDSRIIIDPTCCAGSSKSMHEKALDVMRMCHIEVGYGAPEEDN